MLRLSVATRRLSSDQKLLSRNFDDDTVKADSIRSMRGIAESASTISIGSDSSGSESCLSDEEVTKPHDSLPVVKEGYLVKHAISSRSFFNSARKRYFRLTLDERQKISFLSYYNDDESEEAKGHLILADGCQVTMKSKGKSSSLRVTFYDDIKDAKEKEERDKKHTLILNQTESEDPKDSLKSWAETLEKTIKSISSSKSKAESPDMTHKALKCDTDGK